MIELQKKKFNNISEIKSSSVNILDLLQDDTPRDRPCKGAVIGNVQSGKTANMEALISMAADNGWNVFIILTGTISNLRYQTQNRILSEMWKNPDDPDDATYCYSWMAINPLSNSEDMYTQIEGAFDLSENSMKRYISVSLKNLTHLENLITNLRFDSNASKMKILIIDDEADQASVNTKKMNKTEKENRAKINQLIIDLVYGKSIDHTEAGVPFKSVNYLCYTATPYAILLNESDLGGKHTLYPGDYIFPLTPSDLYIGPNQIFNEEDPALSDHIVIIDDHISDPIAYLKENPEKIPASMKDAICWFICCVAIQRLRHYNNPVSMMLNVDSKQEEHFAVDTAIRTYLQNCKKDILVRCKKQYELQTANLSVDDFKRCLPNYGKSSEIRPITIDDYPPYDDILPEIEKIVSLGATRILMEKTGSSSKQVKTYGSNIHLCVDNCGKNVDAIQDEACFTGRLLYPGKKDLLIEPTPAFIVIGGNTLSRGLTIEGLVVSYFRRTVKQADSLLQMGRWFGFRKHYELLPRIWMDSQCKDAFEVLNKINESLLSKIEEYAENKISPRDYSVRIMDVPESHMLKSLTSRNKMQGVAKNEFSFAGGPDRYISIYPGTAADLQKNLDATKKLLSSIPADKMLSKDSGFVFKQVDKTVVLDYLNKFERPKGKYQNTGDSCINWLMKVSSDIDAFNIAVANRIDPEPAFGNNADWSFGTGRVHKLVRTPKEITSEGIVIKTPRNKKDLLMDISDEVLSKLSKEDYDLLKDGNISVRNRCRNESGWNKTPLLLLGIANYVNEQGEMLPNDVVTVSLLIPSGVNKLVKSKEKYVYLDDGWKDN